MFRSNLIAGKRFVALVCDDVEDADLTELEAFVTREKAHLVLAGLEDDTYLNVGRHRFFREREDVTVEKVDTSSFDALFIPGGRGADRLAATDAVIQLVRRADADKKIIAATGRGVLVLLAAGLVMGRRMTCAPELVPSIEAAAGLYDNRQSVRDHNLITSRKPDDLGAFFQTIKVALRPEITWKFGWRTPAR